MEDVKPHRLMLCLVMYMADVIANIYVADVMATFYIITLWWQMFLPGGRWNNHLWVEWCFVVDVVPLGQMFLPWGLLL